MMDGWFKLYAGAAAWMQRCKDRAIETGFAESMWGGKWFLPGVWCADDMAREEALRQTHALPVQEGAARLMKQAMAVVHGIDLPWARRMGYCEPILQQHDSLLFEIDARLVHKFHKRVKDTLEHVVRWTVPIVAEGSFGESWLEQTEIA